MPERELSEEQRETMAQAAEQADRMIVDSLAREIADRDLAALRADRDGYSATNLKLLRPGDLAEPAAPLRFLIKSVWDEGGFGPFGGAKKSLKTWCAMIHSVAIASGEPSFGYEPWEVPNPRPVLYICGEGGENLARRRLQRIAEMYRVDLNAISLYVVVGVAPFNSDEFRRQIASYVKEIQSKHKEPPGLVVLDSLYNFHPPDIDVANLYGRGGLLSGLEHWVRAITSYNFQPDGAALWVVDHFNKTGKGLDLDRYGQAGMNAWASTWWNAEVIDSAPEQGEFTLRVEVSSREGFHYHYAIAISLGRFNVDSGAYEGELKVVVSPGDPGPSKLTRADRASDAEVSDAIIELLSADPYKRSKSNGVEVVRKSLGVGRNRVWEYWDIMADRQLIHPREGKSHACWAAGPPPKRSARRTRSGTTRSGTRTRGRTSTKRKD